MNWPSIFLGCFVIGFVLSALSFAFGIVGGHVHLPWETQVHIGVSHAPHMHGYSAINFATLTAFFAWFGGTAYLLTTEFRWLLVPTVIASAFAGTIGAGLIFLLMAKVLWSPNENMQTADYDMVGVLGRLTQPIRQGGIGELVYTQGGTRKSCGARSEDMNPIEKGAEVVVTEYARGVATVRRYDDMERV